MRRYGLPAITQSLFHFVLGKGVNAVAALVVLVVAIRQLTNTQFAVYTCDARHGADHRAAVIVRNQPGHETVPARTEGSRRHRGHVSVAVPRDHGTGTYYAAIALLLYMFAGPVCRAFGFDAWVNVVQWYCLVGFLRVNGTFISNALRASCGSAKRSTAARPAVCQALPGRRSRLAWRDGPRRFRLHRDSVGARPAASHPRLGNRSMEIRPGAGYRRSRMYCIAIVLAISVSHSGHMRRISRRSDSAALRIACWQVTSCPLMRSRASA